jgi:hypothetical protein
MLNKESHSRLHLSHNASARTMVSPKEANINLILSGRVGNQEVTYKNIKPQDLMIQDGDYVLPLTPSSP